MISNHNPATTMLRLFLVLAAALLLAACAGSQSTVPSPSVASKLKVVATTTLVGDVVAAIGGDNIDVAVLLPPGAEPHSFQPTPKDVAALSKADLVFVNGVNLEEVLMSTLENALDKAKIVAVSDGVQTIEFAGEVADNHEGETEDEHAHEGADPHTWTDPNNVMVWADNISRALSHGDPAHAAAYAANATAYKKQLGDIDQWVREQVTQVPEANRKLVTDHAVFGYFAKRYGFEQVGAVIPGFSAMAEPSAQEMAALEDTIHSLGVKAVFTGNRVNPALSQRVADDTGVKLVFIYTDSLSEPNGPVPTYLEWVRHNTQAFVDALK